MTRPDVCMCLHVHLGVCVCMWLFMTHMLASGLPVEERLVMGKALGWMCW